MNLDDAARILARLKAAFPMMTLDEEQAEALLLQFRLLHDPSILDEAVEHLIQREERFPPIARIRLVYRSVAGARDAAQQALERKAEPAASERGVPEWVNVWWWRLDQTRTARQAANTKAQGPVELRPPVRMRDFPQMENPEANAYSMEEYEKIRQAWIAAGSPSGSAEEIVSVAGAVASVVA